MSDDACHYVNADFKPLPTHIKEQLPKLIVIDDLKRLVDNLVYGQGKTAKGIVLGKLLVWQYRQAEVDALTLQVAEMKSRLNDAYTDGQSAMYTARQSKIDELQKRVDAVKALIEEYRDPPTEDKTFQHALSIVAYELEQALKGGGDE